MSVLFFYGTLRDADLRQAVTGQRHKVVPAWLEGYRCIPVAGQDYPMLAPCPGGLVEGVLALDVDPRSLQRLIAYEGGEYRLEDVSVRLADGSRSKARLFMTCPGVAGNHQKDWDFQDWQRRRKAQLVRADRLKSKPLNSFD